MIKHVLVVHPINVIAIMSGAADAREMVYKCIEETTMTEEEYEKYEPVEGIVLCARYLPIDHNGDVMLGTEAISIIAGHAAAELVVPYYEEARESLKKHLFDALLEFEDAQTEDAEHNEEGSFLETWLGLSKEDAAKRTLAAMMESLKI